MNNFANICARLPAAVPNAVANDNIWQAPPIVVGTSLDALDVTRAREELGHRMHNEDITAAEITESEIRHDAIICKHVSQIYAISPGALEMVMPPTLEPILEALIAAVDANTAAVNAMISSLANVRICNRNRQAFDDAAARGNGALALYQLRKEVAGNGQNLPGAAAPVAIPAAALVHVGAGVGAVFPATVRALRALTDADVNHLAILFNNDFGIVGGDTLAERVAKFQSFVVGM